MRPIAHAGLAAIVGLFLGCRDDLNAECQPGNEGCGCSGDGECFGDLVCASGTCVNLSDTDGSTGAGTGTGTGSATDSATDSGTGMGTEPTGGGTSGSTGGSTDGSTGSGTTDGTGSTSDSGSTSGSGTDTEGTCPFEGDDFEGDTELDTCWLQHMPAAVNMTMTGTQARLVPDPGTQWFNTDEAALLYKQASGDFLLEAMVYAHNGGSLPSGDIRLGGIMARNPDDTQVENHILWLVGAGVNGVGPVYERKNTFNDASQISVLPNNVPPNAPVLLRMCRIGDVFTFYLDPGNQLTEANGLSVTRPDMPPGLQVGFTAYSANATTDLTADFEYVRLEANPTLSDCEQ